VAPDIDPKAERVRAEVLGRIVERLDLGEIGRAYLRGRGRDPEVACRVGIRSIERPGDWRHALAGLTSRERDAAGLPGSWLPWGGRVPCLLLPYRVGEEIRAIRCRRTTPGDVRYMTLRGGAPRIPWNVDALDGPRPLGIVVTEGELDALACLQSGREAVALGGASPSRALLHALVDGLADAASVALWFDDDRAGDQAAERVTDLLRERYGAPWVAAHVWRWRSASDPANLLRGVP